MRLATFCGLAACAAALLSAPGASAFCRTTTCNPSDPKQACELADNGLCVTSGTPLGWRSSCVTVAVQQMGSPSNGFSYDDIANVVEQGFGAWLGASCAGGKPPSIDVKLIGPVECGESEYNKTAGNANIVLFRDGPWPYKGAQNALGLTTTRFDTTNGDLWDADIELNGADGNFSIGDPITGDDLLSVLTHESGHFLGLSHSTDDAATMRPVYNPQRDGTSFRSLAPDDVAGICAVYPPDRKPATASCDNRHGFSPQCGDDQTPASESKGCSVSRAGGERAPLALLALLAACSVRVARRRRIV
ncbi:MAG TPA: matrixin family metalloprotease [Polyangiaceae bacterium]|nr:matrixin family metalloprotease [Polyangiaceae bacterium]